VWWIGALLLCCLLLPARASAQLLELPALRATTPDGEVGSALREGEYDELDELVTKKSGADALMVRAWRAEMRGEWQEARRFTEAALDRSVAGRERRSAELALARLDWADGEREAALGQLREVLASHPEARAVRFEVGRMLIESGRSAEAEPILDALADDFNRGDLDGAIEYALLGRAMALLGSYQDANQAFRRAIEARGDSVFALVGWGELFLSKYNTRDAKQTYRDALEINPRHPAALVGLARVHMETANHYTRPRDLLKRAEDSYELYPPAVVSRAQISVFDGDWALARQRAERVLEVRPKHLEARSLVAATHYLQDDEDAFEADVDEILEIRPDYADLFTTVASYAKTVHRYREVVTLYRRAVDLAPDNGEALLGLGMGQSRMGQLDDALETLQRAYKVDPYNARALNMVEFFDSSLPDYAALQHDRFLLRVHESERRVLNQIVPPLVNESLEHYDEAYDFRPTGDLSVEIYPTPEAFGVRTVGLPNVSPHGIAFGPVVASRSPSDGNFNWRQVIWHEIAHVYHLKKANYRVPRWFTEGLAEFETNIHRDAWVRHHDRAIADALRRDDIPSVVELNTQFSQAKSYRDILQAYHLSSLVIHFIRQTWSFSAVDRMLKSYAKLLKTERVIPEILGVDIETFDARFKSWLRRRYRRFEDQLLIRPSTFPSTSELNETLSSGRDAEWYAHRAWQLARQKKVEQANGAITEALDRDADNPTVRFVAMLLERQQDRLQEAYEHGTAILEEHHDDYVLRVVLGDVTRQLERPEEALVHLRAATELYPDGARAWNAIRQLADTRGDSGLRRRAIKRLFELDQTSASAARRFYEMSRSAENWSAAKRASDRWMAIQPFEARAHRSRATASMKVDRPDDAVESWLALAAIQPEGEATRSVLEDAIDRLEQAGFRDRAASVKKRLNRRNSP